MKKSGSKGISCANGIGHDNVVSVCLHIVIADEHDAAEGAARNANSLPPEEASVRFCKTLAMVIGASRALRKFFYLLLGHFDHGGELHDLTDNPGAV